MATTTNLVLLTGGNGFIGFRTLRTLLGSGYVVRAIVRSAEKAEKIRSNPALREATPSNLSFAIVPDLTAAGAYDGVMDDVTYVVHVASPVPAEPGPEESLEDKIVKPSVACTFEMLDAARKAGTVQRVVITSSVITIVPTSMILGTRHEEVFGPECRADEIPAPYMDNAMVAYAAGKILTLRRAEEWIDAEKPAFDVIHIHPGYVHGRDDMSRSLEDFSTGTNAPIVDIAIGKHDPMPKVMSAVHVDDVAEAHVRSLNPEVPGGQSFILSHSAPEDLQWNDVKTIVAKHYPDAVEKGILSNDGSCPTAPGKVDNSKTEQVLGIRHKDFEAQVSSVIGHYLEAWKLEKGAAA